MGTPGGVRGVLGTGRECRYSGARRSIGSLRDIGGLLGGVGAIRWCQGCIRGLAGSVGTHRPEGV